MVRVIRIQADSTAPGPMPIKSLALDQRLVTSTIPLIRTESTFSRIRLLPFTARIDGMSTAIRKFIDAWVLFGIVRSIGNTSDFSQRKAWSAVTPQRNTQETFSPDISIWSSCGSPTDAFQRMPRPPLPIFQRVSATSLSGCISYSSLSFPVLYVGREESTISASTRSAEPRITVFSMKSTCFPTVCGIYPATA